MTCASASCQTSAPPTGLFSYAITVRNLGIFSKSLEPFAWHLYLTCVDSTARGTPAVPIAGSGRDPFNPLGVRLHAGPITVGKTVHEAFFMMLELVYACKVQIHVLANASR